MPSTQNEFGAQPRSNGPHASTTTKRPLPLHLAQFAAVLLLACCGSFAGVFVLKQLRKPQWANVLHAKPRPAAGAAASARPPHHGRVVPYLVDGPFDDLRDACVVERAGALGSGALSPPQRPSWLSIFRRCRILPSVRNVVVSIADSWKRGVDHSYDDEDDRVPEQQ